jgi:hypothetical protein
MGFIRLALVLLLALLLIGCDSPPAGSVVGKWAEQNGAAWEFTPDGHVVIKQNSDATYKSTGTNTLTIEYHNLQKFAVDYTYELDGNKLILRPENAHGDGALPRDWDEPTILVRQ